MITQTQGFGTYKNPNIPNYQKLNKKSLVNIPKDVVDKISYLCRNISSVEWSGVLFYTIKGCVSKGTVKIEVKDILPLNKGSQAYTEFTSDERFVQFMMRKTEELGPEVLEWQQGLIHSHNHMGVFFSGTDMDELISSAKNYNQYFSLICNNRMEYCAKIAQHCKYEKELKDVPFMGLGTDGKKEVVLKKTIKVVSEDIIVSDCTIKAAKTKEIVEPIFSDFASRIMVEPKAISSPGQFKKPSYTPYTPPKTPVKTQNPFDSISKKLNNKVDGSDGDLFVLFSGLTEEFTFAGVLLELEDIVEAIDDYLESHKIDPTQFSKTFVTNMVKFCQENKIDFVEFAEYFENEINSLPIIGLGYIQTVCSTILGTVKNIKQPKKIIQNGREIKI